MKTEKSNILLVLHRTPDADAISSAYAIIQLLKQENPDRKFYTLCDKRFTIVFPEQLTIPELTNQIKQEDIPEDCCAYILDHSCKGNSYLKDGDNPKVTEMIIIDHHIYHGDGCDRAKLLIDDKCMSTCEVIYSEMKKDNFKGMTPDIATALYIGMFADALYGQKPIKVKHFTMIADLANNHGAKIDENHMYSTGSYFFQEKAFANLFFYHANKNQKADVVTMNVKNARYIECIKKPYMSFNRVLQRILNCRAVNHVIANLEINPGSFTVIVCTKNPVAMAECVAPKVNVYTPDYVKWTYLKEDKAKMIVRAVRRRLVKGEEEQKPINLLELKDIEPDFFE